MRGDSDESYSLRDSALTRDDPAAGTQEFVKQAVRSYSEVGREATNEYYNWLWSVDGQWYMLMADENDVVLAHTTVSENVGKRAEESYELGGYPASDTVHSESSDQRVWVLDTYLNAATGGGESKHSWGHPTGRVHIRVWLVPARNRPTAAPLA